jgi:thiol-disulfide isomerase/thioredoxin
MSGRGMPRRRRGALVSAAVIATIGAGLLVLLLLPLARARDDAVGQLVGSPAPTLDAVDLDGRRWTLADADGRLVWINFWATWCPPCRTEMPMMQRLHERYADDVLILGVDFGEERGAVDDFVARYGITYPILLDPTLENFYRWSPSFGLPKHYFVDDRGVVVREFPGELPPEAMVDTLLELLADP